MEAIRPSHVFTAVALGAILCAGCAWLAIYSDPLKRPGDLWITGLLVSEHLYLQDSHKYISVRVGEQGEFARRAGTWHLAAGSIRLVPDNPGEKIRWLRRQEQFGCKGLRAVDQNGVALSSSLSVGFYARPGSC